MTFTAHAVVAGDRDWDKPCPVCEKDWDDHGMVGRNTFYTNDVCPINLMEPHGTSWNYIQGLRDRIAQLEKARVSKFRLPEAYFDDDYGKEGE